MRPLCHDHATHRGCGTGPRHSASWWRSGFAVNSWLRSRTLSWHTVSARSRVFSGLTRTDGLTAADDRRCGHAAPPGARCGLDEATATLAQPGRYHTVAGNLRIKDVWPRPQQGVMADRIVICYIPEQAQRDAAIREKLVAELARGKWLLATAGWADGWEAQG